MAARSQARHRVVITGFGCVSPLGVNVEETWAGIVAGRSGIGTITRFDTTEYPVKIAGEVPGELPLGDLSPKEARRLDRFILLAIAAAREALEDSALLQAQIDKTRIGVAVGSGIGGLDTSTEAIRTIDQKGPRKVSPFTVPYMITNMASGYLSILFGLQGPNICHVSACATGAHSLGEAARMIERGDADVMLAGGAEAPVTELSLAAFSSMKALSTRNEEPERASRPFDLDRDGFVMGEGAAVLVLESLEHARARGAKIRGELLGYAATADAAYVAAPSDDGGGARRCMELALRDAGLGVAEIDYINAHGTSTPAGDGIEVKAVRDLFGEHAQRILVSSTKSMLGHMLGAAGAIEALICLKAMETGIAPPTINLDRLDPACELNHVAHKAVEAKLRTALSNSFGFGGTNASLVFGFAEDLR